MLAWTVYRRSQQATTAGDLAQALGLAQAARRGEDALPRPMRAALRVQEARTYALDGDEHQAQLLLDDAHSWAAGDDRCDARRRR
jgi:hypothetical protein